MIDSAKLPITGPCPIDLDAIGFDRKSKSAHCTHCSKSVANLSRMTEDEARQFLTKHAGTRMCVSYARGGDGKIKFKQPEPAPIVPLARLVRKQPARVAAAAGFAAALAACTPVDHPDHHKTGELVVKPTAAKVVAQPAGGIEVPPPEVIEDGEVEIEAPPPVRELAGDVALPPPEELVEGNMKVPEPETVMQGEAIAVDLDKPCDGTKKPATPEAKRAKPVKPGKMQPL